MNGGFLLEICEIGLILCLQQGQARANRFCPGFELRGFSFAAQFTKNRRILIESLEQQRRRRRRVQLLLL